MAGAMEVERLLVRLTGDGKQYFSMLHRAGASTRKFAGTIARIGALATVGVMAASVKAFATFDQAMTESTSIMKVTEDQTKRMRQTALSLSAGGALQAPAELAEAYFFLASAGKNAEQSMALLPKVAQFATAGAFDMATATDLLTDAQSALGLTSKDTTEDMKNLVGLGDVLVKANTLANASVQQFAIALTSKAGESIKSFNKPVEEGVAVLAAMADQGIKAEIAGNALDRIFRLLPKAAKNNQAAFKEFGFSVFDSSGKMRHTADIIKNLTDITAPMSDELRTATLAALGFEARVQGVILPLLGTSKAIRGYHDELDKAGKITDEVANKQMKSFSNQIKVFRNQMLVAGIQIGESLAPAVIRVAQFVSKMVGFFMNIRENSSLLSEWLVDNWKNMWNDVVSLVIAVAKSIPNNIGVMLDTNAKVFSAFAGWLVERFKNLFSFELLDAVLTGLIKIGEKIRAWGSAIWEAIKSALTGGAAGDSSLLDDFINNATENFNKGGAESNFFKTYRDIIEEGVKGLENPLDTFEATIGDLPEFNFDIAGAKTPEELKDMVSEATALTNQALVAGALQEPAADKAIERSAGAALQEGTAGAFAATRIGTGGGNSVEANTKDIAESNKKILEATNDQTAQLKLGKGGAVTPQSIP